MMTGRRAPRPKRGGEEFARTHHSNDPGHDAKKPRFDIRNPSALVADAPEEDAILDADEVGKRGQQTKRNAVNIDGYESDSSNEGFDARADAKAKIAKSENGTKESKDEEEADMFADLEEEFADGDEDDVKDKKKKSVKFVEVENIEGQVSGSKSGGHVSADFSLGTQNGKGKTKEVDDEVESSTDSEVGDEVRAVVDSDMDEELGAGSKKKHAPKLDAFNLHAEKEGGGFDEQLNYVRKAADPDAVHDTWLEGLSKKEMKKAREAQEQRDEERRKKLLEEDSILTSDVLRNLLPYLRPTETALEALARLGKGKEKKPKWQRKNKNRRAQDMDVDIGTPEEEPEETRRRETVEAITEAADLLLKRGSAEIYDMDRELLARMYKRETGEDWVEKPRDVPKEETRQWEYRWSDARDGGDTHGPYDGATMVAWNSAGYFGEGVEFRIVGEGSEDWRRDAEFE